MKKTNSSSDLSFAAKITQFIKIDIWRIRASQLSTRRSFFIRLLRVVLLSIRGFNEDKCILRASALTFYTLLSIVPLVAMAFGIAKGFGLEKLLEKQLMANLPGQEEVAEKIISFAQSFLDNTQGGVIAGIGVAVLFWTVIKVLGNIESSFNDIWGIRTSRSLGRKFSDYLSIMLICPLLLVMSSSVTLLITSQVTMLVEKMAFLGPFSFVILSVLKFLPFMVLWLMFSYIYVFLPNTQVKMRSAVVGGVIAGTIYQLVQFLYINFQIGASKYGAIYGSFAALPLFLIWLQISWHIILFGAELSFAEQNVETYEFEPDCLKVSQSFRKFVSLAIAHLCVTRFDAGEVALNANQISHHLEIPIRLVRQILFDLTEAGVLSEVRTAEEKVIAYQPAKSIEFLTIAEVMGALDHQGSDTLPMAETPEVIALREKLQHFQLAVTKSPENILIKNL